MPVVDCCSSIFSERTIAPLNITPDLLEYLINEYNIPRYFDDVIASFGQEPNLTEGNSNYANMHTNISGTVEVSYQLRYVEQNNRRGPAKWSLRHTGIFYRHTPNEPDLMIVLHPIEDPKFQRTIAVLQEDHVARESFCENPIKLHDTLLICYVDEWRWYLRDIGERFNGENNRAMVVRPEKAEPNAAFACVQELRNAKDLVVFARACCAGNLDLVDHLAHCFAQPPGSRLVLDGHKTKLSGYVASTDVLAERIQNLIDLVGYTLSLHNQLESAKVEKELRDLTEGLNRLTQDNVDDSATVKIITFVSAVYLPGSFIAVSLLHSISHKRSCMF